MIKEHHKTIIIGAGLSGLYCAWKLHQQNHDVIVLDSREHCGGRILSTTPEPETKNPVDLGPSWIWPQYQFRLTKLLSELNITMFKQFTQGDMLYETETEKLERHHSGSTHSQSYRISNGSISLINALVSKLPDNIIKLNTCVKNIQQTALSIQLTYHKKNSKYTADNIILALPPRIARHNIKFNPQLSSNTKKLWSNTSTWMAIHCKIIFIYARPFWREQGLSGEVFSHRGPLSEIYDGSPEDETYFALTCFIGLSTLQRKELTADETKFACLNQLKRLFGNESQKTIDILIKDWSQDINTSTSDDLNSPMQHPQFPQQDTLHLWNKKILLAGTEVAKENGGYLEGALESAEAAIKMLHE